jgi:tRNA threonylcarbamoyladenosine biosynthesis protein TsaB
MNSISKFNLLAIETSTDACSVALLNEVEIVSSTHVEAKKHTQILLKMIDEILIKAGLSIKDCDCLAFGCGPGSFTGVRIASSVIQGFGLATGIPIVPVSTLRAIAQAAYRKNNTWHVLAILDARMQQYYGGLFKADENGIMQSMGEEFLKSETELENLLI